MKYSTFQNWFFLLFIVFFQLSVFSNCVHLGNDRRSSFPYISGDTFRDFCDWVIDETGEHCDPKQVKEGDTIFVRTDMVPDFINKFHSEIDARYILITHNSDFPIPGPSADLLDDDKLIAWFGQNVEYENHPKLHGLPIGIANRYWSHGSIELIGHMQQLTQNTSRPNWLYMNFLIRTYPKERSYVYEHFMDLPFCAIKMNVDSHTYLTDLSQTKFVLSPRGNGIDCHRTWEALLMGAIPIVISSSLNPLYEDLPVLVIDQWEEVTIERLEKEWETMGSKNYNFEKLYAGYWFDLINKFKLKD